MRSSEFIPEDNIEQSTTPNTMSFWHGGNLANEVKYAKGRTEYGPGLYLITRYDVAAKYAKGGRKLYKITVERGSDVRTVEIPIDVVTKFVSSIVSRTKLKDIVERIQNNVRNGAITAETVLNILLNEDSVKSSKMKLLRDFLVNNGCDYEIINNPFGWGNAKMMVLYNMDKIVDAKVVTPKDKILQYDFNDSFN